MNINKYLEKYYDNETDTNTISIASFTETALYKAGRQRSVCQCGHYNANGYASSVWNHKYSKKAESEMGHDSKAMIYLPFMKYNFDNDFVKDRKVHKGLISNQLRLYGAANGSTDLNDRVKDRILSEKYQEKLRKRRPTLFLEMWSSLVEDNPNRFLNDMGFNVKAKLRRKTVTRVVSKRLKESG